MTRTGWLFVTGGALVWISVVILMAVSGHVRTAAFLARVWGSIVAMAGWRVRKHIAANAAQADARAHRTSCSCGEAWADEPGHDWDIADQGQRDGC